MSVATVPQYDEAPIPRCGERAVVVGAGMAGLLAARVLADAFDEVTVVERDSLPDAPLARRGVPQSSHIHVLLNAGRATLEDLFPGYRRDLLAAGGLEIDGAREVDFYAEGDFLADGPERLPHYAATRPLYEWLVRRHLDDVDGVRIRSECLCSDYLTDDAATAVDGVLVTNEDGVEAELDANLVVDATGRPSRTPRWLRRRGYEPPAVEEVHIDLAYSSTLVRRPPEDHRALLVTPSPSSPRGAGVLPVEGDRWIVTVAGMHGDHPPTDAAGFEDFAGSLPVPHVTQLLADHPRASEEIAHYPFPSNRRHRYDAMDRFPEGLVVVGDGVASFNPLYGQGMSVAALESLYLRDALGAAGLTDLAPRFFRRSKRVVDTAWSMAVGADFQFARTTGPKPRGTDLANRYLARLTRKAHRDGVLRDAFFRVMMMERPPSSLFRPGIVWRVVKPTG